MPSFLRPTLLVSTALVAPTALGCSSPSAPTSGSPVQDAALDAESGAALDAAEEAPSTTDASTAASDASDGASCQSFDLDGGVCNSLPLTGPVVTDTCVSGEPPQPQGGPIEDGVYVLQAATWYGGCHPTTTQTTWNVCGSRWDVAQNDVTDASVTTLRIAFVASVGPTSVTLSPACQSGASEPVLTRGYTASPGHLTFITDYAFQPPGVLVGQYVKQ
jgi:hypothetical protein